MSADEDDVEAILARAAAQRRRAAEADPPGPQPLDAAPSPPPVDSGPNRVTLVPLPPIAAPPLEAEPQPAAPPDPFAAAKAALDRARQVRGASAPKLAEPLDPTDPFAAARRALRTADSVRGVNPPLGAPTSTSTDPMAAAEAALARAKEARSSQPTDIRLAEALVAAKLRKLKAQRAAPEPDEDTE